MKNNPLEIKGLLLVISAPSGTGKSTLIRRLTRKYSQFTFSTSYTTRKPRPGELNGREYWFCSKEEFEDRIENNFFAEWARVHDDYYGTPREPVLKAVESGNNLIFDIDVQGARQLKSSLGFGCFVFLFPPSLDELQNRLLTRGTDDPEKIKTRLKNAAEEIKQSDFFHYWVINDDLDRAFRQVECIIRAEACRPDHNPGLLQKVLSGVI
ncbi:MAG: guanylate kinase [Desulfonatronovibrionaceae bacterium]